jgi:hypothetical protein
MTMTKKRLLLIASLPLIAAVALGVLAMLPPSTGVTKANFDRIQGGMTLAEVKEIFGRKADESMRYVAYGKVKQETERIWAADDGSAAFVEFRDDCVTGKEWAGFNETFLDKIRRWLHLR